MKVCVSIGALALLVTGCMSQEQRAALLNGPYPLHVDYSRSIEDSLIAGRYDRVYYRVTSASFPGSETGRGKIAAVLVPFSPQASLDYVLHRQAEAGLRPATLKELLAFGEAYPEVQRKLPVMALGSSADLMVTIIHKDSRQDSMMPMFTEIERKVERVYPFLGGGLPGRTVNLDWLDDPEGYTMYYACFVQPQ
jgi:hypothetical protein